VISHAPKRKFASGSIGSFRTTRSVVAGPIGVRPKWSHWLALAGMVFFSTRKSRAVLYVGRNYLIFAQ
jgi:hypothetical protein